MVEYTTAKASAAFTEWMRRYIEDPAAFEAEFNVVAAYRDGGEISYGDAQAEYFEKLMAEV